MVTSALPDKFDWTAIKLSGDPAGVKGHDDTDTDDIADENDDEDKCTTEAEKPETLWQLWEVGGGE